MKKAFKKLVVRSMALVTLLSIPSGFALGEDAVTQTASTPATPESQNLCAQIKKFENLQRGIFKVDPAVCDSSQINTAIAHQTIEQITMIFEEYYGITKLLVKQIKETSSNPRLTIGLINDEYIHSEPRKECSMTDHTDYEKFPPVIYTLDEGEFKILINNKLWQNRIESGQAIFAPSLRFSVAYAMGHLIDTTLKCEKIPMLLPYLLGLHTHKTHDAISDKSVSAPGANPLEIVLAKDVNEHFQSYIAQLKNFDLLSDSKLPPPFKSYMDKYGFSSDLTFNPLGNTKNNKLFAEAFAKKYICYQGVTPFTEGLHYLLQYYNSVFAIKYPR